MAAPLWLVILAIALFTVNAIVSWCHIVFNAAQIEALRRHLKLPVPVFRVFFFSAHYPSLA